MFADLIFALVRFRARHGLAEPFCELTPPTMGPPRPNPDPDAEATQALAAKQRARRTGVCGESYACWFLRSNGYVMVARNFMTPGVKGEIYIVGFDRPTLVFVEIKTRSASDDGAKHLRPEDAVTSEKQRNVLRVAQRFRLARRVDTANCRFDVVAIETHAGVPPSSVSIKAYLVPAAHKARVSRVAEYC
jgi:putative endonuclease